MEKINFENGKLLTPASVDINGLKYNVIEAEYTGQTPLTALVLNKMQDNIEKAINEEHKYIKKMEYGLTSEQALRMPAYYKVGTDVLDVYLNGERLIKANLNDISTGHYIEDPSKTDGEVTNIICITGDWVIEEGDILEFVIRGEYNDTTMQTN